MKSTNPQAGWVAGWPVEGESLEIIIQNPNTEMNAEFYRVVYRLAVAASRPMKVNEIGGEGVPSRPKHLFCSVEP